MIKSKMIFGVLCSVLSYNLHAGYVSFRPNKVLEGDHEVVLPSKWRSQNHITSGCFGQTGSLLALASGEKVMLYLMGSKKDRNGSLVRIPGQFLDRFHFKSPVTSVALDETTDSFYVTTDSSIVSRVNWRTKQQQDIEVSLLSGLLKISPFQENIISISGDDCSVLYNVSTNRIVTRKNHKLTDKTMKPHFAWRLRNDCDGKVVIKSRVDILPRGTLCANHPGDVHPIVKTGMSEVEKLQLVIVNSNREESYRALSGIPTSLVRSPLNPNQIVVGYEDGNMEIIDLTILSVRSKYKDIRPPFIFNPHGTVLVGTRGQKFVMVYTDSSQEESALIQQSLVLAGIQAVEEKAILNKVLSSLQLHSEEHQVKEKPKKKKNRFGGNKKKKNRRKKH